MNGAEREGSRTTGRMEINDWWSGDSGERYWLEITDREDLGVDLHAPQLDGGGRVNWTYDLVRSVEPGDVVLHWHKNLIGRPAIVGYSEAVGPVGESSIVWQARGTYGRARGPASQAVPSRYMPLRNYTALAEPVDQDVLRSVEPDLRDAFDRLTGEHNGSLYFPFAFSDKRPVRATQGYLVKFPAQLLTLIPGLGPVPTGSRRPPAAPGTGEKPTATGSDRVRRSARGAGYIADSVLRRALEQHAVAQATAYYQRQEWDVEDVGSRMSFDLLLTDPTGGPERHVEVKGSSSQDAGEVELTVAEVKHSRGDVPCDLFVVDGIEYSPDGLGGYTPRGGVQRVWVDWRAGRDSLKATRFRYTLPDDGEEVTPTA